MQIRFDLKDDKEIIREDIQIEYPLGENFMNFISLNMENILNDNIINNLTEKNYKNVVDNIIKNIEKNVKFVPEFFKIKAVGTLGYVKSKMKEILKTYKDFKSMIEFCYFSKKNEKMTPLQNFIYYLHLNSVKNIQLPKETISMFSISANKKNGKIVKNDDVFVMLQKNSPYLIYAYEVSSIYDYMIVTFLKIVENNYMVLKCKNCNKYFIPYKRIDTLYCDRISPQNSSKNCKQYGAEQEWNRKMKEDGGWQKLQRKIYMSLQMAAKREDENSNYHKENFIKYKENVKQWKKDIRDGGKTEDEFIEWLKKFKGGR